LAIPQTSSYPKMPHSTSIFWFSVDNKIYFFSILERKKYPHVYKLEANSSSLCRTALWMSSHVNACCGLKAAEVGSGLGTSPHWGFTRLPGFVPLLPGCPITFHPLYGLSFLWTLTWRLNWGSQCVLFWYWSPSLGKCSLNPGWAFVYKQAFHSFFFQFSL
jgi:hypothetical protein